VRKFKNLAKNYGFSAVSISYGICRKLQSCSATHNASIGIFEYVQNRFLIFLMVSNLRKKLKINDKTVVFCKVFKLTHALTDIAATLIGRNPGQGSVFHTLNVLKPAI
jgi:hypothetical protein